MDRRFLVVLLAAGALAACRRDPPDPEPVDRSPAPSMDDAQSPRFGQPTLPPPVAPAPAAQAAAPARPSEPPPPRPPADIPLNGPAAPAPADVRPGADSLTQGYDAAHLRATAPRPQIGAEARPLYSAPLSQLLGASGFGIHLTRSALKVRGEDNAEYFISAQSARLGEQKAYVIVYRDGLRAPAAVDMGDIKQSNALFNFFAGGTIEDFDAGGRRFGITMHGDVHDSKCAATHPSQIEIWAASRRDPAHTSQFSISRLFAETAKAGVALNGAKARGSLVAYRDVPFASGKVSVALFDAEGFMVTIPTDLLARQGGKAISIALHGAPAQRFGLRLSGSGDAQTLDVFDLSGAGRQPPATPYESLVPPYRCQ